MRSRGPAAARLVASCAIDVLAEHGLLAHRLKIARLPDGRAYLLDACFLSMPSPIGGRVLEFLRATASERPQDVAAVWGHEIEASGADSGVVRSQLRQATPRRGGAEGAGETSAEYAVAYWRAAARSGVEFGEMWHAAFVTVEWLRRRFLDWDPAGDALSHALVEQSWRQGWQRLRTMATPQRMGALADRYTQAFVQLPHLLDRLLDLPAARPSRREPEPPARLRVAAPYLIALVAISLVVKSFGDAPAVETTATVLFMLLALSLLRVVWR